ncbi:hypothetical protein D187_009141 [Cystobacter fuscus DSM 2262]|uniref:Uncharacterized protein n=1 Tax=Cystobacter fuscus (strain ATCC 25194 / DSM 2262 / NBRC 100088 / M29) TaxID=1242864 RepID=S9NTR2_CYSF2|nr:hypothetical protein D187_009141 [Cystobacter fuscus DSM 2262]
MPLPASLPGAALAAPSHPASVSRPLPPCPSLPLGPARQLTAGARFPACSPAEAPGGTADGSYPTFWGLLLLPSSTRETAKQEPNAVHPFDGATGHDASQ